MAKTILAGVITTSFVVMSLHPLAFAAPSSVPGLSPHDESQRLHEQIEYAQRYRDNLLIEIDHYEQKIMDLQQKQAHLVHQRLSTKRQAAWLDRLPISFRRPDSDYFDLLEALELRLRRIDTELAHIDAELADLELIYTRHLRRQHRLEHASEQLAARQKLLAAAVQLAASSTPPPTVSGPIAFSWPLDPHANWRVTSLYGNRLHPILKEWRMHHGIDLAAPTGTPIRAAADGVVAYAGTIDGYGNIVTLLHASGYETRYAHADRILVRPQQHVKRGQVIALVGSTGLATGPHLHFEVRQDGQSKNPLSHLSLRP